jgi:GNAT superfamily N-acetyltransferase
VAVDQSTDEDLEYILHWLKAQWDDDGGGSGFWGNRKIIRKAHEETSEMWVVREDGKAVAFQVGRYSPDITCVKDTHQRKGYGSALFRAGLERAHADDVTMLSGECNPEASLPFWLKMGFKQTKENRGYRQGIPVEMWLPRNLPFPDGDVATDVEVELAIFPEKVRWEKSTRAATVVRPTARMKAGKTRVHLGERFFIPDQSDSLGDPVLMCTVNGRQVFFDKAKYPEAEALGVQRDPLGTRYIDFLDVPAI